MNLIISHLIYVAIGGQNIFIKFLSDDAWMRSYVSLFGLNVFLLILILTSSPLNSKSHDIDIPRVFGQFLNHFFVIFGVIL